MRIRIKTKSLIGIILMVLLITGVSLLTSDSAPNTRPSSPSDIPSSERITSEENEQAASDEITAPTPSMVNDQPVLIKATERSATMITRGDGAYPLRIYKPLITPNDPNATQWWTTNTGLHDAWNFGSGASQTMVAVIDTGFALNHEEFAGRWATNTSESGTVASEAASRLNCTARSLALNMSCNLIDDDHDGITDNESGATTKESPSLLNCSSQGLALDKSCNRIDDDGNGFVDDVTGWDFVNNDNSVLAGVVSPTGGGTAHGTEVAGVLGASGNNGKGIAGVDWSTKILPLQAIDDDEYGDTLTVANAVEYAANRGADVISLSLGASAEDPYLRQVIQYAIDQGSIVVAASGNDGCDCISYPARYPEVLAVGAVNSSGNPASFSSYGSTLDILAPGTGITTSAWTSANQTGAYASNVAGTSFATPYVSGLLSLARSQKPTASWGELLSALLSQADHVGLSTAAPFSPTLGFGNVHAGRYLTRVSSSATPKLRYEFTPISKADPLGSKRPYQCGNGEFPSATIYELTKANDVRYTISPLEKVKAASSGWATSRQWYTCVGMPDDSPETSRSLNLIREINDVTMLKASGF